MQLKMLLAATVMLMLMAAPVMADNYTYTYTGNPFTNSISPPGTGYTLGSDFVSGYFTSDGPLPSNVSHFLVNSPDFSFTDHHFNTASSSSIYLGPPSIMVSTDSQGDITDWGIGLWVAESPSVTGWIGSCKNMSSPSVSCVGYSFDDAYADNDVYGAQSFGLPGTWTVTGGTESPVPEPSSIAMLGSVMLVVIRIVKVRRLT